MKKMVPYRLALVMALLAFAGGCHNGELCVLGYTTAPPYDPNIRTVYIPLFKMYPFHTSPYRGLDADLTEAIVKEINSRRTPLRVVSDPRGADTELIGTIASVTKTLQNRNQFNHAREFDVVIQADILWRDLRTGKVLSGTRNPTATAEPVPFDPNIAPGSPPPPEVGVSPVSVFGYGRVIPELGESNTTGAKAAVDNLARQIVNMMEKPW